MAFSEFFRNRSSLPSACRTFEPLQTLLHTPGSRIGQPGQQDTGSSLVGVPSALGDQLVRAPGNSVSASGF